MSVMTREQIEKQKAWLNVITWTQEGWIKDLFDTTESLMDENSRLKSKINNLSIQEFEWLKKENKKLLEGSETTQLENDLLKENLKVQKTVMDEYRIENEKLTEALKDILEVTEPMVRDWKVCPVCNGTWDEHKYGCSLNQVVFKARKYLGAKC